MEQAAERGADKAFFKHRYVNGYRPDISDLEKIPEYEYLMASCHHLGLEAVVMTHQMLKNRDPKEYPCIEVMITLPSRFRDAERTEKDSS